MIAVPKPRRQRQRKKRGQKIDGWVVLDKPAGMTSTQAVGAVKRLLNPLKAGHAGTLDPLATGILPVGLGEATKTMAFVTDAAKEYEFAIKWGEARSTDDAEGEITDTSHVRPSDDEIDAALGQFIGDIEQVPPAFSAIKVDGRRAYDLARAGKAPKLGARTVRVERFERIAQAGNNNDPEQTRFRLLCGKGTYVRSLARDLAGVLGTFGFVAELRRTRVGPFTEKDAISLELLNDLSHSARAAESVLPVMTVLDDIPALAVTDYEADRLRHGQSIKLPTARCGLVCVTHNDVPLALAEVQNGNVRPVRVFNLS